MPTKKAAKRSDKEPRKKAPAKPRKSPTRPKSTKAETARALSILMVASEGHPFAKTGGLAEVVGALPDALARLGHKVTVVLPKYRGVECDGGDEVRFDLGGRSQRVRFCRQTLPSGVTAILVGAPELYDRDGLYGSSAGDYADNARRFAVLSRAALEYARVRREPPSIIHVHDWQTGLVPVYQKLHFSRDPIVGGVPVVCTIHNLAFQGIFPAETLNDIGIGWEAFDLQAMEYWGKISYLKGGINFSERITTVSPTYAKEILTPELGFGFDGVLRRRADSLSGILNGIDFDRWNPAADQLIPAPYTADDLSGKRTSKIAVMAAAGLAGTNVERPLIGLISRLTTQKGLDLFELAAPRLMALDASWVMLGSGDERYERLWRTLAAGHADRVGVTIGFDERLAHLIEAGADMFLMPSRFEPCGLNQMYSLRYGTVPIVRATGGLEDTVIDATENRGQATGFKFFDYNAAALVGCVRRALKTFGNSQEWKNIQHAGMREDHSWNASAREYVKVYEGAVMAAASS